MICVGGPDGKALETIRVNLRKTTNLLGWQVVDYKEELPKL